MKVSKVLGAIDQAIRLLDKEDEGLKPFLEEAKKCIAVCPGCHGRGTVFLTNRARPGNYKVRTLRGGGTLYEYDCHRCEATGQVLKAKCSSCLKEYEGEARPRPTQLEIIYMDNMCDDCFSAREAKSGLVPLEQPKPSDETKKMEAVKPEAKNDNPPAPKLKGRR